MTDSGSIIFQIYTSEAQIPVENAYVTVRSQESPEKLFGIRVTDSSGKTAPIIVPTGSAALSQAPESLVKPWTGCIARIEHPEFEQVTLYGLQVFPGITTLQQVQLVPMRVPGIDKNGNIDINLPPQELWEGN